MERKARDFIPSDQIMPTNDSEVGAHATITQVSTIPEKDQDMCRTGLGMGNFKDMSGD
jgi:hypothetical protein